MDQVVRQAVSDRNAVLVAIAMSDGEVSPDMQIPTTDEAIMRLDDALLADDELSPEQVDPERVALRRALNLPDVPAAITRGG